LYSVPCATTTRSPSSVGGGSRWHLPDLGGSRGNSQKEDPGERGPSTKPAIKLASKPQAPHASSCPGTPERLRPTRGHWTGSRKRRTRFRPRGGGEPVVPRSVHTAALNIELWKPNQGALACSGLFPPGKRVCVDASGWLGILLMQRPTKTRLSEFRDFTSRIVGWAWLPVGHRSGASWRPVDTE